MSRRLLLCFAVLLGGLSLACAADYQVTVSIDDEGLAFLQRTWPNLSPAQLRAKVGEVCSQKIQQAGARDVSTELAETEQRYRRSTPAQQAAFRAALRAALPALGE
jgi:hypothetical protein